jgi:hypothetical protein
MKVVFIHGAPAAGKLTTARALLDRVGGRLFDNHAAIDVARTVFEFGTPEFWELVQATRVLVLESASKVHHLILAVSICAVFRWEDRP